MFFFALTRSTNHQPWPTSPDAVQEKLLSEYEEEVKATRKSSHAKKDSNASDDWEKLSDDWGVQNTVDYQILYFEILWRWRHSLYFCIISCTLHVPRPPPLQWPVFKLWKLAGFHLSEIQEIFWGLEALSCTISRISKPVLENIFCNRTTVM